MLTKFDSNIWRHVLQHLDQVEITNLFRVCRYLNDDIFLNNFINFVKKWCTCDRVHVLDDICAINNYNDKTGNLNNLTEKPIDKIPDKYVLYHHDKSDIVNGCITYKIGERVADFLKYFTNLHNVPHWYDRVYCLCYNTDNYIVNICVKYNFLFPEKSSYVICSDMNNLAFASPFRINTGTWAYEGLIYSSISRNHYIRVHSSPGCYIRYNILNIDAIVKKFVKLNAADQIDGKFLAKIISKTTIFKRCGLFTYELTEHGLY